eukprot:TRINITY_DN5645_c0_g1_i2.p1 TRINITY_DN5645_c0_g1~~TRINITY_DN5645_c0_g1_i2.p1  ORF type:complete len:441 (-),score=109.62 TRINITY_DN5645_c0_g1_i2:9-1331(-)
MMLLVIDAVKGFQTQTAEGLVIGELLADKLTVVLNKVDQFPEATREKQIERLKTRVAKTMETTKFRGCPMICVAANPHTQDEKGGLIPTPPIGIDELVKHLTEFADLPKRSAEGKFLMSIDHCFPIKGQGTVVTGTILSGSVQLNQNIEFPELNLQRKVKSMQMFHRPVPKAMQGDRLGICVTQLDSKQMERGLAADPGVVMTINNCIISVNKIRFFKSAIKTKAKFHVTVGFQTVMANILIFGLDKEKKALESQTSSMSISEGFNFGQEYLYQEELYPDDAEHPAGTQWALLQFEKPVICPLRSLVIGSRLETDIHTNTCRLAFFGRLLEPIDTNAPYALQRLKIYKPKQKEGGIDRVTDERTLIGKNLFKKETNINLFIGLKVQRSSDGSVGVIESAFGKSGKFKVFFANGTTKDTNGTLILRFKKYLYAKDKKKLVQ